MRNQPLTLQKFGFGQRLRIMLLYNSLARIIFSSHSSTSLILCYLYKHALLLDSPASGNLEQAFLIKYEPNDANRPPRKASYSVQHHARADEALIGAVHCTINEHLELRELQTQSEEAT